MNTRDATDLAEISIILARLSGPNVSAYRVASNVMRLNRLGREAHTWAERLCNYGEPSEGADERKRASIAHRAASALAEISSKVFSGVKIDVMGDPRGSCLQVTLPGSVCPIRF